MSSSRFGWCGVLILVGMLVGLAEGTAGDKKNPATTPMNRDNARHKEFLAIAKKGGVEVVFIGDSITQGWGKNEAWKKYFEPIKAANFGIGGDQTGHVLWRITEGKELDEITPKVAVLMIGTNNTGRDSAGEIAEGITLIVKTIHEKTPKTKVLLLGVFPRDTKPGTKNRNKIIEINKIIAKLDDGGKTVKYLDIGEKFLEPDGTLSKEVMPDALHLSGKGYQIWAEAINPTLQEMLK
jgi:lysophospholipase L1-like esterase